MQIVGIYEAGQVTELDGEPAEVIRQRRPVAVDDYVRFRLGPMEEVGGIVILVLVMESFDCRRLFVKRANLIEVWW